MEPLPPLLEPTTLEASSAVHRIRYSGLASSSQRDGNFLAPFFLNQSDWRFVIPEMPPFGNLWSKCTIPKRTTQVMFFVCANIWEGVKTNASARTSGREVFIL